MAIWDIRPRVDVVSGIAVGVGVAAAPVVVPLAWRIIRPLVKAFMKSGFMLYETGRTIFCEVAEKARIEGPQELTIETTEAGRPPEAKEYTLEATTTQKQAVQEMQRAPAVKGRSKKGRTQGAEVSLSKRKKEQLPGD